MRPPVPVAPTVAAGYQVPPTSANFKVQPVPKAYPGSAFQWLSGGESSSTLVRAAPMPPTAVPLPSAAVAAASAAGASASAVVPPAAAAPQLAASYNQSLYCHCCCVTLPNQLMWESHIRTQDHLDAKREYLTMAKGMGK